MPNVYLRRYKAARTRRFIALVFGNALWLFLCQKHDSTSKHKPTIMVSFGTQGGFANQVLDVVYATTVAAVMEPSLLVLSDLWGNGTQYDGIQRDTSKVVTFKHVFDLKSFQSFVSRRGVVVIYATLPVESACGLTCLAGRSIDHCFHHLDTLPQMSCSTGQYRSTIPSRNMVLEVSVISHRNFSRRHEPP